MINYIGKLTFCQPHAHGTNENNGTNIWICPTNSNVIGISVDTGTHYYRDNDTEISGDRETQHYESSHGIRPSNVLRDYSLYNLSLNTLNTIKY
jgi:hypothetical protein